MDSQNPRIVTTSWDDGDASDLRVADYLDARRLTGTFYVPVTPYQARPPLTHRDLRSLSTAGFEIGAHGLRHRILSTLSTDELAKEVGECKPILEDVLGKNVAMFCYPRGRYTREAIRLVRQAGYQGARTVHMLVTSLRFDPFKMPTTVQAYPHPWSAYVRNLLRSGRAGALCRYVTRFRQLERWVELGKRMFDTVLERGGLWHLYGHSWEVDQLGLWDDLKEMLDYVAGRDGVRYLTNTDVVNSLVGGRPAQDPRPRAISA